MKDHILYWRNDQYTTIVSQDDKQALLLDPSRILFR